MTAQKIDLVELRRSAFMAGFSASCEGYNGEYPFCDDLERVSRELEDVFQDYLDEPVDASPSAVDGLPLRDWFAGQYICGTVANPHILDLEDAGANAALCAEVAYQMADAMLAAREVQS